MRFVDIRTDCSVKSPSDASFVFFKWGWSEAPGVPPLIGAQSQIQPEYHVPGHFEQVVWSGSMLESENLFSERSGEFTPGVEGATFMQPQSGSQGRTRGFSDGNLIGLLNLPFWKRDVEFTEKQRGACRASQKPTWGDLFRDDPFRDGMRVVVTYDSVNSVRVRRRVFEFDRTGDLSSRRFRLFGGKTHRMFLDV